MLETAQNLSPPKLPPRYEVHDVIGAGGCGVVYRATHKVTDRPVALKVVHPTLIDDDGRARFRREARLLAQMDHPHIVRVSDAGCDEEGGVYLAMELLEGESMDEWLARGPHPVEEILALMLPVLDALQCVHDAGLIHRDIKPANIYLARKPNGGFVPKLIDFGVARPAEDSTMTRVGLTLGTPEYMSPEQATDPNSCGPATDLWAFGVMLYEALTGDPPFRDENAIITVARACQEPHVPPSHRRPGLDVRIDDIVDACLQKRAADRPPNAEALRVQLELALCQQGPRVFMPTPPPARFGGDIAATTSMPAFNLRAHTGPMPGMLGDQRPAQPSIDPLALAVADLGAMAMGLETAEPTYPIHSTGPLAPVDDDPFAPTAPMPQVPALATTPPPPVAPPPPSTPLGFAEVELDLDLDLSARPKRSTMTQRVQTIATEPTPLPEAESSGGDLRRVLFGLAFLLFAAIAWGALKPAPVVEVPVDPRPTIRSAELRETTTRRREPPTRAVTDVFQHQ